ncbi:MAG: acyl-CoA thioesterase [Halocynthiibacter sp.]
MYPVLRLLSTVIRAHFAAKVPATGTGEMSFICRPWDLDMFMEMNNGRILTLFDLGRFDLTIRAGVVPVMRAKKWGLAVAGSTVRYRKRITAFKRVTMRTRLAGYDDKWILIEQSMWLGDQPAASILLRTCFTAKGRAVSTQEALEAIGLSDWTPQLSDWADGWAKNDNIRPWPPMMDETL